MQVSPPSTAPPIDNNGVFSIVSTQALVFLATSPADHFHLLSFFCSDTHNVLSLYLIYTFPKRKIPQEGRVKKIYWNLMAVAGFMLNPVAVGYKVHSPVNSPHIVLQLISVC